MLDNSSLRAQKVEPRLLELMASPDCPELIGVIVQTVDDPNDSDRRLVQTLRGNFLESFTIIPAYVAELSAKAIDSIILSDRVRAVTYNSKF